MADRAPRTASRVAIKRPVLYQLCRAGERFEVGDGPVPLGARNIVIGRGDVSKTDLQNGRVAVDDLWMSGKHAQVFPLERRGTETSQRLRGADGGALPGRFAIEDMGSTNGVLVNGAPARRVPLLHGDIVETGRTFWIYVEEPATDLMLDAPFELGPLVTWTPWFAAQLKELAARAKEDTHVLLTGPEGTGKGFVARTLHQQSGRSGRFVHLDCRERKHKRLVVDLFGDRASGGRLRDAANGTLFLENLDALPLELQDRLVGALDNNAVVYDGKSERRPVPILARVVASMAPTPSEAIAKNHVRAALTERLGQLDMQMPTLSQRLPDLGLLLDDFLARARAAPSMTRDATRVLLRAASRFNVKTLSRVVEAGASIASIGAGGGRTGLLDLQHLPVEIVGPDVLRALMPPIAGGIGTELTGEGSLTDNTGPEPSSNTFQDQATDPLQRPLRRGGRAGTPPHGVPSQAQESAEEPVHSIDPEELQAALRATHGNVSAAARRIGRPRALLQRWCIEFNIDPAQFR